MVIKKLLDSCILIDHFNGIPQATIYLKTYKQAAMAIHYNLKLVTHNTKDFNSNEHPFVEIPYTLS